jgi:penicillin-binding protein 2
MSVIHIPRRNELDLRSAGFLIAVGIALIVFFLRLWYLQLVVAADLAEKATALRTVAVRRIAPRGLILDRNGVTLAGVKPKWVVAATPFQAKSNPWVIKKIAAMLTVPEEKLWEKIKANEWRPHIPIPIFVGANIDVATKIAESGDYLPGIEVDTQPMRVLMDTLAFSHIMGYVWTPNDTDVKRLKAQGIEIPEYVGKNGIEREYERLLQGRRGIDRFEVDNKRRPKRVVQRNAPRPGSRITLSIDSGLQKYATGLLKGYRGAAVAMDPSTGEILAMVSSPSFDSTMFEGGISKLDYEKLLNDPGIPELNRAVAARYAPGSTFKILTAIASQLSGKFNPTRTVYCPGYHELGNKKTKCLGVHGAIRFHEAFEKSCNTYFATIGLEAGIDELRKAAKFCGLGEQMGVDLPSESNGTFPFEEWIAKKQVKWYRGDTVNASIGQGYVTTTPLQMACIASLVANQGTIFQPRFLRAIQEPGKTSPPIMQGSKQTNSVELPAEFWRALQSAMVSVIESGTATRARIPNLIWGGKTGSSEHQTGSKTHAWFVGVAPIASPKIVVSVVIEGVGHGGDFSAPIGRAIVQRYLFKPTKLALANSNASRASASNERISASVAPAGSSNEAILSPDSRQRNASSTPSPANR